MDLPVRIAITGSGRYLLDGISQCARVNEVLATAVAVRRVLPRARTVIDLGGQFSKWILWAMAQEKPSSIFRVTVCARPEPEHFFEQQASRLHLTVDRLGSMAAAARRGATIAGRCSVFAKSDMIHLQQKGTPLEELAYGLCQALARTFLSTVAQGRTLASPVVLAGGGAANPGLLRAFREQLGLSGDELLAPEDALFFGALGTAQLVSAQLAAEAPITDFPRFLDALRERAAATTTMCGAPVLPPLPPCPEDLQPEAAENPPVMPGPLDAYLGLDVGSGSTNLVLLSPDFKVLAGIYLPTLGRPVEVLHQGLSEIRERFGERLSILGVGATGSGRHLSAKATGADVTHNEITAQMVSSLLFFPHLDTIFEIGGQDSKYISVRDGRLADFEMNKICAGGTGSFLEEQAERLRIQIVAEFSDLALRGSAPCDLGARCTVFMDTELVQAQERGAKLEDLCAGLANSVARNYLQKVVAARPIGRSILFQGGTASNRAVVAAFRQLLGRPITVHPYNRISGAIGAAVLAARAKPQRTRFLGLESCSASTLRSFECPRCENRCQVNRIKLGTRMVHFGDICERYSQRDSTLQPVHRPELFAERERLLETHVATDVTGGPRLGLLRASLNLEFLPFWVTFLQKLGYDAIVSELDHSRALE